MWKRWRLGVTVRVPLTDIGVTVGAGVPTSYDAALAFRASLGPVEISFYAGSWFASEDGDRMLVGGGIYVQPRPFECLICRLVGHRVEQSAGHFTGTYPRWEWCSRCGDEISHNPGPDDPRPGRSQPNAADAVELRKAA